MSLAAINAALAEVLASVGGIGQVHADEPYAATAKQFRDFFGVGRGSAQYIHGWTIARQSTEEHYLTNLEVERTHRCVLRGVYSVNTTQHSEAVFQAVVEAICTAFRSLHDLQGQAELKYPLQVDLVEHRLFGDILCHYAELSTLVQERIQWE